MFFRTVLLTLATSALVAHAAPTQASPVAIDPVTLAQMQGLTYYDSSDVLPFPSNETAPPFAATCWAPKDSNGAVSHHCAMFTIAADPSTGFAGFGKRIGDFDSTPVAWTHPGLIASEPTYRGGAMAALNNYVLGGNDTLLFYADNNGYLMYIQGIMTGTSTLGGPSEWDYSTWVRAPTTNDTMTDIPNFMTTLVFADSSGSPEFGVWYSDSRGQVYQYHADLAGWHYDGRLSGVATTLPFSASVQGGVVTITPAGQRAMVSSTRLSRRSLRT